VVDGCDRAGMGSSGRGRPDNLAGMLRYVTVLLRRVRSCHRENPLDP